MKIGTIDLGERPVILAPMEDVTDIGFRLLCKHFGAAMVYTEFVSAEALVRDVQSTVRKLTISNDERPVGIQLYGRDTEAMVEAARIVEQAGPDVIDLNFGCPVKKVAGKGAGAGMLQNVPKLLDITRRVVDAVSVPVTVKTRLGWNHEQLIITELAEQLQDCGIQALTIHGRTRSQMYTGSADWTLIGEVKRNPRIHIPIIGNGDIHSLAEADRAFETYGVDGVMIGRATFGCPWIFSRRELTLDEKIDVLEQQLNINIERIDEYRGIMHTRRHLAATPVFKGIPNFRETRIKMLRAEKKEELTGILESCRKLLATLLIVLGLTSVLPSWAQRTISLSDGWQCQSTAVTDGSSYRATVPSTVMGVLTANGEYPDVLTAMNYRQVDKHRFDVPWVYLTSFDLDALASDEHVTLRFEGISYSADIWLNGKLVASRDNVRGPFRVFEFDVTPMAQAHNTLKVTVYRAQPGDPNIGFVDWNPRPADESMGLFRPVSVRRTGAVAIKNPCVRSCVNMQSLDEAWLTVETDVENLTDAPQTGTLSGLLEGRTFAVPYSLQPRERRTLRISTDDTPVLHVLHPRLWWCHTLGSPELYDLTLTARQGGTPSDEATVRFGIREVGSFITREGYRAFTLNGRRILLTGAGWTDDIFLRDTPERYREQLQMVRDMNLNMVRLEGFWGTSQALYDLCDSMGILLLAGWSCHWEWESYMGKPCDEERYGGIISDDDISLISRSFDDQLRYLRHHPSIMAWFTGSDRRPAPALEQHYEWVRRNIDDRPMIISAKELESDISGTSGTKMAGPYEYVAPVYWYCAEAPGGAFGFNTETGIGAQLPVRESVEQMLGKDCWPIDSVWSYHCTASATEFNSLRVLTETIRQRYGEATTLDEYLRKASMVNYDGTRAMFEAFRYNFPRATAIVQWMLNGARPGLYWQLYDHYLRPTAAYYAVRKACQPLQLIYNYKTGQVRAVNSLLHDVDANARLTMYATDGTILDQQQVSLHIGANGHADAFTVKPLPTQPMAKGQQPTVNGQCPNAYLFLELESPDGKPLADNTYTLSADHDSFDWPKSDWTGTPMLHHADHRAIGAASTDGCTVSEQHTSTTVTLTVTNPTDHVAYFLHLALHTPEGKLIDRVTFSDNYISLPPHASRTVTCRLDKPQPCRAVITPSY